MTTRKQIEEIIESNWPTRGFADERRKQDSVVLEIMSVIEPHDEIEG